MPGDMNDVPVLIAQDGALQGSRWSLDGEELLVGRTGDCDVVIPDRRVSRHHARILRGEGGYLIEDLGSKNGTFVDGVRVIDKAALPDGCVIQIGMAINLVFVGRDATVPLSMEDAVAFGLGRLRIDRDGHRVWIEESELQPALSSRQYRLLELLYSNAGRLVSRGAVVDAVWPEASGVGVSEQAVDALVRRLRERLAEVDPGREYITTVRGHGLRFENPV